MKRPKQPVMLACYEDTESLLRYINLIKTRVMDKTNVKKPHASNTGHCNSDKSHHNTKDSKDCNKK